MNEIVKVAFPQGVRRCFDLTGGFAHISARHRNLGVKVVSSLAHRVREIVHIVGANAFLLRNFVLKSILGGGRYILGGFNRVRSVALQGLGGSGGELRRGILDVAAGRLCLFSNVPNISGSTLV